MICNKSIYRTFLYIFSSAEIVWLEIWTYPDVEKCPDLKPDNSCTYVKVYLSNNVLQF